MLTVSVIIPTYNREFCIERAIHSVLNQSFTDFELIVVDDASNDNTANIIHQFKDDRIHYVKHPKNKGASAARNTGIRLAKGEYIALLDSDDEWHPEKLVLQLELMRHTFPNVHVSCTGFTLNLLDENKTINNTLQHHLDINQSIVEGCDLSPGSTMMVHSSVFKQKDLYFDENLPRLEDWDWLLRYHAEGSLVLLHQLLATVNNKRGGEGDALKKSVSILVKKHEQLFNSLGYKRKGIILADLWLQVVGTYRREMKYRGAFFALFIAHMWNPFVLCKYMLKKRLVCG